MPYVLRFFLSFILFWTVFFQNGRAQVNRSVFENFFTELETNSLYVNAILQDNDGFLWLGTDQGLIRYDGIKFRYYLPESGNNRCISHKWITALYQDATGNLWIGTRRGLNRYNTRYNDFDRYVHDSGNSQSLTNDEVSAICEDREGNLWVGTFSGLNKITFTDHENKFPDGASFKHFFKIPGDTTSITNNTIWSIAFDSLNHGWIGTDEGLELLLEDRGHYKFLHFTNNPKNKNSIARNNVLKIFLDHMGNLWITSKQPMLDMIPAESIRSGEYRFLHMLPQIKSSVSANIVATNVFYLDRNNYGWLGLPNFGLIRFTLKSDSAIEVHEHFRNIPSSARSICGNSVWSICEDKNGEIWIGTQSGVSRYTFNSELFSIISCVKPYYNFEESSINSIVSDNKNIWIGGLSDTIYAISPSRKRLTKILCTPANSFQTINQLLIGKNKQLYAGTNRGLYIIDISDEEKMFRSRIVHAQSKMFCNEEGKPKKLTSNTILSLFEDKSGNVWIGTGKGLNKLDPATGNIITAYANKESEDLNASFIIRHITQTKDGHLWLATDNGLFEFEPGTMNQTSYFQKENDSNSLPDNAVSFICESADGTLWLATGKGLSSYNRSSKQFSLHPLPVTGEYFSIASIMEDDNRQLWISSNQGLFKFIPEKQQVNRYTVSNGLSTNRFIPSSVSKTSNGLIFFGGEKGFISFYPDRITKNETRPPVTITDFKLFDSSLFHSRDTARITSFLAKRTIHLKHDQNFFSIDFAALNFLFPEANQYVYQLEGIDKNPVKAGNRTTASYTNVPPASYTFKVTGSNNDGLWNEQGALLNIIISPPWWQTWWFYTLVLIVVVSILYAFYRYRINQIKKVFTLRSKIARDLHDDVGSTLSSITLLSQLAKDRTDGQDKEQELFETISTASREAMELMSDIVWSVNPNNDKLSNILIRMREYASDMLEASNIEFTINLADEVKDLVIPMENRKDFYLIFKESVNNTAKYSQAKHASIRLFKEHHKLVMVIEDNGCGFEVDKLRSGNGLINMKERAKFIGGTLELHSQPQKGTSVRLEMPIVT